MMPIRFGSATPAFDDARRRRPRCPCTPFDAQRAVVEVDELLAEAGGAADVRREDGDAAREQRLVRGC